MRALASLFWLAFAALFALTSAFGVFIAVTATAKGDNYGKWLGWAVAVMFAAMVPLAIYKLRGAILGGRRQGKDRSAINPEKEIEFRATWAFSLVGFFFFLGLGTGCFLMVLADPQPSPQNFGFAIGAIVCGLGPIVYFFWPNKSISKLILSRSGMNLSTLKAGLISWPDIAGVRTSWHKASEFVHVEIRDPEKYYARGLPRPKRLFSFSPDSKSHWVLINPDQIGALAGEIREAIEIRLEKFGAKSTPTTSANTVARPSTVIRQ